MAFLHCSKKGVEANLENRRLVELADRALNYYPDQMRDIEPRLRKLNLQWGLQKVLDKLSVPAALAGGALAFLLRRRFATAASFCLAGYLLQQALLKRVALLATSRHRIVRGRNEIELERYALKAQRGDFGKLEVIPFK